MKRLFHANLVRLLRDKVFWLSNGILLIYTVVYMLNACRQERSGLVGTHFLEDYYFQFTIFIGLFTAVFTTLYLSTEYSDGIMRNKIIGGHTRRNIYLSNLTLSFLASIFMTFMGLLGGLVGIPTFGVWKINGFSMFCRILILILFLLAFCAIFTFISMLLPNKSVSAVITILTFFGLLLMASMMMNKLDQPAMISDTILTVDGIQFSDPMPNPKYVEGKIRDILDFAIDLLPSGQGARFSINEVNYPVRMMLSSAFISVFVTALGMFFFEKKDLK